jgi:acetyl-CoA acetyltransferase
MPATGAKPDAVEVAGPTSICEVAALKSILRQNGWSLDDSHINASGGGAACFFGPATGLRHIAFAAKEVSGRNASGIAIDLAGPIGQLTTVVVLDGVPR